MLKEKSRNAVKVTCLMLIVLLLFSGCRITHYNRIEAGSYMRETYPNAKFTMRLSAEMIERENGRPLKVWEAWFKDYPELPFYVISSGSYVSEHTEYSLGDTASGVFGEYYAGNYDFGNIRMYYSEFDAKLCYRFNLYFPYLNRAELEKTIAVLKEFHDYLTAQPVPVEIVYCFDFESPLDVVRDSVYTHTYVYDMSQEACDEILMDYARYAANTRVNVEDFTTEELTNAVAHADGNSDDRFVFCLPSGETGYFEDLGLDGANLSFGVLYELLLRTGYPVEGTAQYFAFTGADGNEYVFSYSFNDEPFHSGGELVPGFYYMKNGERVPMPYFQYYSINSTLCYEITGIMFDSVFPASLTWQEGMNQLLLEIAENHMP